MKAWIMELCPEIQEWQAELIAEEAAKSDTALLRQAWEALRQCEYTSAPAQRPMIKSTIAALQERLGE